MDDKTPQDFYLGGGYAETVMSPAGAIVLLLAGVLILLLPRKYVVIPIILAMLIVPRGEVLVLAGFHLTPARLVPIFGWARVVLIRLSATTSDARNRLSSIDSILLWGAVASACAFVVLWLRPAAVFNQIGILWGSLGVYFLLRSLITNEDDIYRAIKTLIIVAIINAAVMVFEHFQLRNLIGAYIGGVPIISTVRDGKVRSQGAFAHAILAGTYGATLLPLVMLVAKNTRARILPLAGVCGTVVIVYTSASSTPAIALGAGLLGLCLWPLRARMRRLRWGIVVALILLQLVMKAPVWFLIARMDLVGGSSGYHRAELVDVFIRHFGEWWLVGTKDAGQWGWEMFDASNQYISKGEGGGLLGLSLFILLISRCFGRLGQARRSVPRLRRNEWLMWCLGAALFSHVVGFFGISYWDQIEVAWLILIACISVATAGHLTTRRPERAGVSDAAKDVELSSAVGR